MRLFHLLTTLPLLTSVISAQTLVVPTSASSTDANSSALAPGCFGPTRWQCIIDPGHLSSLVGTPLTGISFRRDAGFTKALAGGTASVTVVISHAPHGSLQLKEEFDLNHDPVLNNRVVALQGTIALPASSAPSGRTVSWSDPQDVIELTFASSFFYVSGPLCVEVRAQPTTGSETGLWAMDATGETAVGTVNRVGSPCGFFPATRVSGGLQTVAVSPIELTPGNSARFVARGRPGTTAAFMFGVQPLSIDLSLFGLGDPGCILGVNPLASVTSTFQASPPLPGGSSTLQLKISNDPTALGATFIIQALEFGVPIYTSEALHCQIAPQLPSLGMAFVTAKIDGPLPTSGVVWTSRAPVMRFSY